MIELTEAHFPGRSWERDLLNPIVGSTMLELGNKRKGNMVYKRVFESLGIRHTSIDINGKDGALPYDLRKPLDLGTFDMVTNFGTTEHVSERDYQGQITCWRNVLGFMAIDSVLVSITPLKECQKWARHGRWYPQPEFFEELAEHNGLEVDRLYTDSNLVYARLVKLENVPFVMPLRGMWRNPNDLKNPDNV